MVLINALTKPSDLKIDLHTNKWIEPYFQLNTALCAMKNLWVFIDFLNTSIYNNDKINIHTYIKSACGRKPWSINSYDISVLINRVSQRQKYKQVTVFIYFFKCFIYDFNCFYLSKILLVSKPRPMRIGGN